MSDLNPQDYGSVLDIIHQLNQFDDSETFADRALKLIPKIVHSEASFYCRGSLQNVSVFCPPFDSQPLEQVLQHYAHELPIICNYLKTGNTDAHKISDLLNIRELEHIEGMYQQFMQPLGLMDQMVVVLPIANLFPSPHSPWGQQETITIALHRQQRDFTERDRTILNLLRPHLYQAYQNAQAWHQTQQKLTQLNDTIECLGAIVLTLDGKVQSLPQPARNILARYFSPGAEWGDCLPETLQGWVERQLLRHSAELLTPCLPLQVESEHHRLSIRLIYNAHHDQCLLLLEEQMSSTLSIPALESLGLTRREAEVLWAIMHSQEPSEIAIEFGISDRTVKKHLEHIYAKIGGNTRVSVVLNALTNLGIIPAATDKIGDAAPQT
jgi:DNA-binding CsgD family transcriptional regulator